MVQIGNLIFKVSEPIQALVFLSLRTSSGRLWVSLNTPLLFIGGKLGHCAGWRVGRV